MEMIVKLNSRNLRLLTKSLNIFKDKVHILKKNSQQDLLLLKEIKLLNKICN